MTALEALKQELRILQEAQTRCVSEGVVKDHYKHQYQLISRKIAAFQEIISWFEDRLASKSRISHLLGVR